MRTNTPKGRREDRAETLRRREVRRVKYGTDLRGGR